MRWLACSMCLLAASCGSGPPSDAADGGGAPIVATACGTSVCLDLREPATVPDLGAASGAHVRDQRAYLLGDRDGGIIREYVIGDGGALEYTELEIRTRDRDGPLAPNPSGLTHRIATTLLGDNSDGVGSIFFLIWENATDGRDLRTAVLTETIDDLGRDPTGPEIVEIGETWLVASADRDPTDPMLRLYDPDALANAAATSDAGVLTAEFALPSPARSLLAWQRVVVVVGTDNVLRFVDVAASIDAGAAVVTDAIELSSDDAVVDLAPIGPSQWLVVSDGLLDNVTRADLRLADTADLRLAGANQRSAK